MVEWLETLNYDAEDREFESRLWSTQDWKTQSIQKQMGIFFDPGKDKAAKGEGWDPPFICCAQDRVGL